MYYVYVLKSESDGKLYYGYTVDLKRRLNEHNSGEVKSTRNRRPLKVVYFEAVEKQEEALKKERYFKSGFGRKYIKRKLALSSPPALPVVGSGQVTVRTQDKIE